MIPENLKPSLLRVLISLIMALHTALHFRQHNNKSTMLFEVFLMDSPDHVLVENTAACSFSQFRNIQKNYRTNTVCLNAYPCILTCIM